MAPIQARRTLRSKPVSQDHVPRRPGLLQPVSRKDTEMTRTPQRLLIAAMLAACGATAFAQSAPAPAAEPGANPPPPVLVRGERPDPALHQQRMAEHHARRMAQLKAKLKITPAQEGAWNSFASAMQPPALDERAPLDREAFAKLTTPQRIDQMEKLEAQHSAHRRERNAAIKAFYGQLTPYQQGVFDGISLRQGEPRGPGMHGGPGPRGPGAPGMPGPALR